jgi:hypothetical protein
MACANDWQVAVVANRPVYTRLTRAAAFSETGLLLAAAEAVLWTDSRHVLPSTARTLMAALLAAVVLALLYRQRPHLGDLGLAPISFSHGIGWLAAITVAGMSLCVAGGLAWNTIGATDDLGRWVAQNWAMEGVQQLVLQVVLVSRLNVLLGGPGLRVSLIAAGVFSLLHAPNAILMALTFPAGLAWCEWFRRYRNLPALWVSHLLLAATTLYCLNGPGLRVLRVGIAYVFYRG